jgi:hypothetical protein
MPQASTAMMALISPFPESIAAIASRIKKRAATLFFSHPACSTLNCNHP